MDELRLTVIQKDASDNPAVTANSDSDAHSDANPVVTLYSVVILYSSDRGSDALYSSIVIECVYGPTLYTAVVPARRIITAPEQSLNRACRGVLARRQIP